MNETHRDLLAQSALTSAELEQQVNYVLDGGVWVVVSITNGTAVLAEIWDY